MKKNKIIAVIFAGGVGSRMKRKDLPKQFIEVNEKPIIVHTLDNFQNNDLIDDIVVVMLDTYIEKMNELKEKFNISKIKYIVPGGETGQESIYNGLCAANKIDKNSIVLIHDGVRPIIESDLIERNINSVKEFGSAISSVPCKETIVRKDDNNDIIDYIDRSTVWIARAPQSFYLKDILKCHEQARSEGINNIIDSSNMMIRYGNKLHIVETISENLKVTTPEDIYVLEGLINNKEKVIDE